MIHNFLNKLWFAWDPSIDTAVAITTALIMIGEGYYLMTHLPADSTIKTIYEFILTFSLVFPVWWILGYKDGSLKELSIKKEGMTLSLIISIFIAFNCLMYFLSQYPVNGSSLIPLF